MVVLAKISCFGCCYCAVVGFICNVVRPLFTEWHRLLASSLSLLLLDNLQANLQRWQSVSADNVSQLTVADSSDDSSPSNADQGDRQLLNVSSEIAHSTQHAIHSDGGGDCIQCGPQTENVLRRASLPPLSASTFARVADRRGSSPVIGSHHISCRRVCFLSSLAEYPAPSIALPLITCCERLTTSSDLDVSEFGNDDELTNESRNCDKDVILADSNVCLSSSESRHCCVPADGTLQFSKNDSTLVIYTDDIVSNGASLNGVSLSLPKPKCASVRRASAPVCCGTPFPPACATRRGSAPSPGAEIVSLSLSASKVYFDAKPFSAVHCQQPSVVLVESPHLNVGVDQLDFVCMVTNNGSLKVPLMPDAERSRKKRSHSAHAVIINPMRFVARRYSSPVSLHNCLNASNFVNQSPSSNSCTPLSISGLFFKRFLCFYFLLLM